VYRLIYKGKPLIVPVTQHGKTVPELLDQLKQYEPRTRYRARRELRDRPLGEVTAAIPAWIGKQNPKDAGYEHRLLEALWVQQGHHAVDPTLLKKMLRAKTGEARAAATRVLADEWEFIPNAMELLRPQVVDEFPRTRVEAIRALSFVNTLEAVETVLLAATLPRDYWIEYTLIATLSALDPVWRPALAENKVATKNSEGLALLRQVENTSKPGGTVELALKRYLGSADLSKAGRAEIYQEIAHAKGVVANGQAIYRRICIACHQVGGEGVEYGPSLTEVGKRLKREELVESILDPNAKIDPKYATTTITTHAGEAFAGFVFGETNESLTLKIPGAADRDLKKSEVARTETLKISSMPEGLASGMSTAEFIDLIEYLASLKGPAQ
jgi:putative heme-binding domain-containing protein